MEKYNYNGEELSYEDLCKKLIIESIQNVYKDKTKYIQTQILTTSVYRILYSFFVENKKIIFLDAPTGTGKSIIGYMIHYCYYWIKDKINFIKTGNDSNFTYPLTYTLTSSKILQEQLENDFNNFDMLNHFTMLKGMSNYECKLGTKESNTYVAYPDRVCKGVPRDKLENWECWETCEYIQRRNSASISPSAVINYSYFLTIMNARFSPYFSKRELVIADEGHLVPQIVTGMFNIDLNLFKLNKLSKIITNIIFNFEQKLNKELNPLIKELSNKYNFFTTDNHSLQEIIIYIEEFQELCKSVVNLMPIVEKDYNSIYPVFNEMFKKDFSDISEKMITIDFDKNIEYLKSLELRPNDIFIEGQSIGYNSYNIGNIFLDSKEYYKFIIRDLSEAEVTKKYFLSHCEKVIFMSATIGDINEFGTLLGLSKEEYSGFNLPSTFNFEKSPIYLTNSGYLNYDSFQKNIYKVLDDVVKIVTKLHPKYGGIIHTSTFQITNMLKEVLKKYDLKNMDRYLFYENSAEKDFQIEKMRKSNGKYPYIIIGPSLYEGIDLKNDLGRLNILVKAPYAGMDNYTRKKIKRFPFFYLRETKEKLMQAIGRTNRNKTDWSITYLLDTSLEKLIWDMPKYITDRIKKKKL